MTFFSPTIEYLFVRNGQPCPAISIAPPYLAVVFAEVRCENKLRDELSDELVRTGCRVMMAVGEDCSAWDDSVDIASLQQHDFGPIPDEDFVMTTWHREESLAEIFWFATFSGREWTDISISTFLILHVGQEERRAELLDLFANAEAYVDFGD